jgi:DNA-binding Xre family transcriptional regulator
MMLIVRGLKVPSTDDRGAMERALNNCDREELLAALGAAVRARRSELKYSQEHLADISALDRTYIGGIERGERNIGFLNLLVLSRALEVSPSDLISAFEEKARWTT